MSCFFSFTKALQHAKEDEEEEEEEEQEEDEQPIEVPKKPTTVTKKLSDERVSKLE